MGIQTPLFPKIASAFPATRYQGSKAKLVDWIWEKTSRLRFDTFLDAFGGTGAVSFRMKKAGKQVYYNDLLRFNYLIGRALIENPGITLEPREIDDLLHGSGESSPRTITNNFGDIYFTDDENVWLDRVVTNIRKINDPFKSSIAFFSLFQACIIKRPYNLFHRKNLYVRMAEVERSFGNKATWDKPFEEWFRVFAQEANQCVFDNGRENRAFNLNALEVPGRFDLVYVDPPYVSAKGSGVDYRDFYHFLEGITQYEDWPSMIDFSSKHRRLQALKNEWSDKRWITQAFEKLIARYCGSTIVISYRDDGIPSIADLVRLLEEHKSEVEVVHFGKYKYVLSTNGSSQEVLIIAQ